jgi:uncharacterized membrane protein YuzA (DUF378 family)
MKKIFISILLLAVVMVFFFGIYSWKNKSVDDIIKGRKLYYICIASAMYGLSFVVFLLAQKVLIKSVSCIAMGVFSINLYEEIMIGDKAWTGVDYGLMGLASLNLLILWVVIEKYKRNVHDSVNN